MNLLAKWNEIGVKGVTCSVLPTTSLDSILSIVYGRTANTGLYTPG